MHISFFRLTSGRLRNFVRRVNRIVCPAGSIVSYFPRCYTGNTHAENIARFALARDVRGNIVATPVHPVGSHLCRYISRDVKRLRLFRSRILKDLNKWNERDNDVSKWDKSWPYLIFNGEGEGGNLAPFVFSIFFSRDTISFYFCSHPVAPSVYLTL